MEVKVVPVRSITVRLAGEYLYLTEAEAKDLQRQLNERLDITIAMTTSTDNGTIKKRKLKERKLKERESVSCTASTPLPYTPHTASIPLPHTPLWRFEWPDRKI